MTLQSPKDFFSSLAGCTTKLHTPLTSSLFVLPTVSFFLPGWIVNSSILHIKLSTVLNWHIKSKDVCSHRPVSEILALNLT